MKKVNRIAGKAKALKKLEIDAAMTEKEVAILMAIITVFSVIAGFVILV